MLSFDSVYTRTQQIITTTSSFHHQPSDQQATEYQYLPDELIDIIFCHLSPAQVWEIRFFSRFHYDQVFRRLHRNIYPLVGRDPYYSAKILKYSLPGIHPRDLPKIFCPRSTGVLRHSCATIPATNKHHHGKIVSNVFWSKFLGSLELLRFSPRFLGSILNEMKWELPDLIEIMDTWSPSLSSCGLVLKQLNNIKTDEVIALISFLAREKSLQGAGGLKKKC